MADYRFVTTWCLDAPIERVFDAIDDAAAWPQPLARPAFAWNHDVVMRQGTEGLAQLLGSPLVARS